MGKSFKLRNGLLFLSTEAPGGVYNASQLKKIAALCESDSAIAKATEDQRLAIFAPVDRAAQIAKELRSVGLGVRHYQDGLHQPVNCIGDLCGEYQQDAMGTSMDLARALGSAVLTAAPLKIGINGCGRCCVPTHTLDISVVGESQGYRVSVGGRSAQLPELASYLAEGIPAVELPGLLTKVVTLFKMLGQSGESLQDVIERCGSKPFLDALAPYSQDGFGATTNSTPGDQELNPESSGGVDEAFSAELPDAALPYETDAVQAFESDLVDAGALDIPLASTEDFLDEELVEDHEPLKEATKKLGDQAPPSALGNPISETPDHSVPQDMYAGHDHSLAMMDGLPGFDPNLDAHHGTSGPTIDGLKLVGEHQEGTRVGLEPDLLSEEFPREDPMTILEDDVLREYPPETLTDMTDTNAAQNDFASVESMPAPVEEGFDAQEALADDSEEILTDLPAEETLSDRDALQDLNLEAVAGLEPIEGEPFSPQATPSGEHSPTASHETAQEADFDEADLEGDMEAQVIEGPDADELEAKIAKSIAVEGSLAPVEDENAAARLEAMTLISGGEEIPAFEETNEVLAAPVDFSDLEIDAEPILSPALRAHEGNSSHLGEGGFELEELEGALDDAPPISETHRRDQSPSPETKSRKENARQASQGLESQATPESKVQGNSGSHPRSDEPKGSQSGRREAPTAGPMAPGFALSGVDLTGEGRISLAFASGMSLLVDPSMILPGMTKGFSFGGQRIDITAEGHGLNVEVDGVKIFLPVAAA